MQALAPPLPVTIRAWWTHSEHIQHVLYYAWEPALSQGLIIHEENKLPLWRLDEAVLMAKGISPSALDCGPIENLAIEFAHDPEMHARFHGKLTVSPIRFRDQYRRAQRAAMAGELPAEQRGEHWYVKPGDFAYWWKTRVNMLHPLVWDKLQLAQAPASPQAAIEAPQAPAEAARKTAPKRPGRKLQYDPAKEKRVRYLLQEFRNIGGRGIPQFVEENRDDLPAEYRNVQAMYAFEEREKYRKKQAQE